MKEIYVFGKGGHAKVIIDVIEKTEGISVKGIIDKDVAENETFLDYPVYPELAVSTLKIKYAIVGVGSGEIRKAIMEKNSHLNFISLVHPSAQIGKDVVIEDGVVVMAGAVVNPCTILKKGSLVNTSASVDHDCEIGEYSSISPGATLGGGVILGELVNIGLGACLIQQIQVGVKTTIGAGSVVLKNIDPNSIAFGVPCQIQG
tara:strand:- start:1873 stop:2481 length:609 start_codon:yes stop_codon:yes gene_type:complete